MRELTLSAGQMEKQLINRLSRQQTPSFASEVKVKVDQLFATHGL